MQKLINSVWTDCIESDLVNGEMHRIPIGGSVINGVLVGNGWEQKPYQAPVVDTTAIYQTANESILTNGAPALGAPNTYFAAVGDTITLSLELHKDGAIDVTRDQPSLGYPPALNMPVVKMAGGVGGIVVDEIYLNTTIVNGVLNASGVLPSSGAWILVTDRLNKSLAVIDNTWRIERANLTFLV